MTQQTFSDIRSLITDLDLKVNQFQNSAGVLEAADQHSLDAIEAASKALVAAVTAHDSDLTPEDKARIAKRQHDMQTQVHGQPLPFVSPNETAREQADRLARERNAPHPVTQ